MTLPKHIPVLKDEVLHYLIGERRTPMRIVDGTVGFGGHAEAMLQLNPEAELIGFDRDTQALAYARERLAFAAERVTLVHTAFDGLEAALAEKGWDKVDTVLLDIGVSSVQIDEPDRGFSFRSEGPLDMRMNREDSVTASKLINTAPVEELKRIFRDYGEIRTAGKFADALVKARAKRAFQSTSEFASFCMDNLPKPRPGTLPTPTLAFQALRIAVNDELGQLERTLPLAVEHLRDGGRLAVISFHSLEDRIVKNFMRDEATDCLCPPGLPVCCCGHVPRLRLVTPKVVVATDAEAVSNPRAGCAKLRVAERGKK